MTITKERQREVPPFLQEHYMGIRTDELEFWSGAVAKGERGHPTRTRTRVYSVPNMHSDRNAKEPGSMAWQSELILICSDDHIDHGCLHLKSTRSRSDAKEWVE